MPDTAPVFRSSIVSPVASDPGAALTLEDLTESAKVIVRGEAGDHLGVGFASSRRDDNGTLILGTRPEEWTLIGDLADTSAIIERIPTGGFVSIIDWSHCRALLRLSGDDAPRCLEKICGIDLSDAMTPDGAVFSASIAKVTGDLARDDVDGRRSYLILSDRSSGQYLYDSIIDAGGTEFGIAAAH